MHTTQLDSVLKAGRASRRGRAMLAHFSNTLAVRGSGQARTDVVCEEEIAAGGARLPSPGSWVDRLHSPLEAP